MSGSLTDIRASLLSEIEYAERRVKAADRCFSELERDLAAVGLRRKSEYDAMHAAKAALTDFDSIHKPNL